MSNLENNIATDTVSDDEMDSVEPLAPVDRTPPPDIAVPVAPVAPVSASKGSTALVRSWRTVLQGFVSVVLVAGVDALHGSINGGHFNVGAVALAVGMAVLTAAVTFVHNVVTP